MLNDFITNRCYISHNILCKLVYITEIIFKEREAVVR